MPYRFETFSYAEISTNHLTQRDKKLLNELESVTAESNESLYFCNMVLMGKKEPGVHLTESWFINLGNDFTEESKGELIDAGFSESFAEIIWQLAQQQIYYVRFYNDGYELDGVPTFA